MKIIIKSETIKRNKKSYNGKFRLNNGDTICFSIDNENGFIQWGTSKEILWQLIPRIEELQNEFASELYKSRR